MGTEAPRAPRLNPQAHLAQLTRASAGRRPRDAAQSRSGAEAGGKHMRVLGDPEPGSSLILCRLLRRTLLASPDYTTGHLGAPKSRVQKCERGHLLGQEVTLLGGHPFTQTHRQTAGRLATRRDRVDALGTEGRGVACGPACVEPGVVREASQESKCSGLSNTRAAGAGDDKRPTWDKAGGPCTPGPSIPRHPLSHLPPSHPLKDGCIAREPIPRGRLP